MSTTVTNQPDQCTRETLTTTCHRCGQPLPLTRSQYVEHQLRPYTCERASCEARESHRVEVSS